MSAIFEAKFPGRCGSCDDRIREGDQVMYDEDQLIHAQCEATGFDDPTTACPNCHLIHAGDCF